jgi:hypothetical protein
VGAGLRGLLGGLWAIGEIEGFGSVEKYGIFV